MSCFPTRMVGNAVENSLSCHSISWHAHIPPTFSAFGVWVRKGGHKEEKLWAAPSIGCWLILLVTQEKMSIKVPWPFVFLRLHCLLYGFEISSGLTANYGLFWLSVLLLIRSQIQHTYFVLSLSHTELPHIWGPLGFRAHDTLQMQYLKGASKIADLHFEHISPDHMCAPLSHQTSLIKCKFKHKIIKNFKTTTAEH